MLVILNKSCSYKILLSYVHLLKNITLFYSILEYEIGCPLVVSLFRRRFKREYAESRPTGTYSYLWKNWHCTGCGREEGPLGPNQGVKIQSLLWKLQKIVMCWVKLFLGSSDSDTKTTRIRLNSRKARVWDFVIKTRLATTDSTRVRPPSGEFG